MKKIKIYLCDLANELYGELDNRSFPIGVGYVGAYCKDKYEEEVSVRVFRTIKPYLEAIKDRPPDIAGFGSYDWNYNLTLKAINETKTADPACLTVFGGANVDAQPDSNKKFLKENLNVDFLVYGDGEFPFSNIVAAAIRCINDGSPFSTIKKDKIAGARVLDGDELVMGDAIDPVMDLSEIPSPYLTGIFDEFLENESLLPIIQNIRGCPYSCRYCVSGTQFGRIRHFPFKRVTEEIDFLRSRSKNRFLRFSDDNFGVIDHDLQLAKYIRSSFDTNGYPAGLKAYSAKKQNDRTRLVALTLKPLMTYVISFQTTTRKVLKETKRTSATYEEAAKSLSYARKHNLSTGTELIFGLPGETILSWKNVINETLGLRFDSVTSRSLSLLRASEFNRIESRKDYQYRGKFILSESAVTMFDEFFSMERDEIAVENKYYSFEDWQQYLKYEILMNVLIARGYGRELVYYADSIGVLPTKLFDLLCSNSEKYPIFAELTSAYVATYLEHIFDSEHELEIYVRAFIREHPNDKEALLTLGHWRVVVSYLVKYFFDDPESKILVELRDAVEECFSGSEIRQAQVKDELDCLLELAVKLVINPRKRFDSEILFECDYDLEEWTLDGFSRPLNQYHLVEPARFILYSRNRIAVATTIQQDHDERRKDCFNFFRYMNSGLMRRLIKREVDEGFMIPVSPLDATAAYP